MLIHAPRLDLLPEGSNVKVLRRLLKKGRSIDVADNRGWMPIHKAAYHNSVA